MRWGVIIAGTFCAILATVPAARAGLYHPDVLLAPDMDENGYAIPLSLDSFLTMFSVAGEADARPVNLPESDRHKELVTSVRERLVKGTDKLTPKEVIDLSADLLRLRRDPWAVKDALNLLQRFKRQPPDGFEFLTLTHLAHAHWLNPEGRDLSQVYELEYSAVKDFRFPIEMAGLTAAQLKWYARLERDFYLPFLHHRREEAATRRPSVQDGLDPIFPGPPKKGVETVRFVGESGHYEAGAIGAAEKAKLPPDATAIVQQLILWDPDDNRLWWQLGELYNADGDLKSAAHVFNLLLDIQGGRKYTNRELIEHNAIVSPAWQRQQEIESQLQETRRRADQEKKQRAEEDKRRAERQKQLRELLVAGSVALVLAFISYWQTREFIRRRQRRARAINHIE
jgi:hypothetical protein